MISPEAIGNAQRWNLYSYCGNNPISFIDPDGRETVLIQYNSNTNRISVYYGDICAFSANASNNVWSSDPNNPNPSFAKGKYDVVGLFWRGEQNWKVGMGDWMITFNPDQLMSSGLTKNYCIHNEPRDGLSDGFGNFGWEHVTEGCIRVEGIVGYFIWAWETLTGEKVSYLEVI